MVYNGYILVLDHHLSYLYGAFCDTFMWWYECETHCFLLFEMLVKLGKKSYFGCFFSPFSSI
uniref:Uncharacterized protein n=1 Tax=Manihot esculenta TaxID=3983 RepID=A0A2C9V8J1_MANES